MKWSSDKPLPAEVSFVDDDVKPGIANHDRSDLAHRNVISCRPYKDA